MINPTPLDVSQFLIGAACIHLAGESDCRYFCRIILKDGTNKGRTIHNVAIASLLEVIPSSRITVLGDNTRFQFCAAESVPRGESLLISFFKFGPDAPWLV